MIIESYEPYHLGIKLDLIVNLIGLRDKLKKLLKEKGYEESAAQPQFGLEPAVEVLGIRDGVRIELNFVAQAINTIGDEPGKVFEQFEELVKLFSDMGYDTNIAIPFYEIVTNIDVKSEKNPVELIDSAVKLSIEPPLSTRGVTVTSLRISNKLKPEMREVFTDISIQPNPVNPSNRFFIQLVYRSKSRDEIKSFHDQLEDTVLKILNSLGAS